MKKMLVFVFLFLTCTPPPPTVPSPALGRSFYAINPDDVRETLRMLGAKLVKIDTIRVRGQSPFYLIYYKRIGD